MSIYSGFATRFQEEAYDHCVDSLLYILQKRIIKFYRGEAADEDKFVTLVIKLAQQMRNMEKSKYLDPKSSVALNQLVKFMQAYQTNLPIVPEIEPQPVPETEVKAPPSREATVEKEEKRGNESQKKKDTLWVEKVIPVQAEPQISPPQIKIMAEQQVQTLGTINYDKKNANQQKDSQDFKRTVFNSGAIIRAGKVKATSRTNLSRDYRERKERGELESHPSVRNKSNSNCLPQAVHLLPSQAIYHVSSNGESESNATHKRRRKSISRTGGTTAQEMANFEMRNEVSDIIREYITKAKKSYLRGQNYRNDREAFTKLHDF